MAKLEKNGNGKVRITIALITCVLVLLGAFTGIILYASDVDNLATHAHEEVDLLKLEGCNLSTTNEKDIIAIKKDVSTTADTVGEIRKEQKQMRDDVTYIRARLE